MEPLFISIPKTFTDFEPELSTLTSKAHKAGFSPCDISIVRHEEDSVLFAKGILRYSISILSPTEIIITGLECTSSWKVIFGEGKDVVVLPNGVELSWTHSDSGFIVSSLEALIARTVFALALEYLIEDALLIARALAHVSCETWPNHLDHFPKLNPTIPVVNTQRRATACLGLYPVVDSLALIEELAPLGLKIMQLRIKDKLPSEVESDINQAIQIGKRNNVDVVINDYWKTALDGGADCIHLGQEDLSSLSSSELMHSNIGLGISTHGYYEILNALQYSPSYLALGHIFPTPTKDMPSAPQGLIKLGYYQQLIDSIESLLDISLPTVAIGGIDKQRAPAVIDTGVDSVAVVRAVTQASNKMHAVDGFQSLFGSRELEC
ncbi:thiamine phosphate synthase [Vibrio gallicus]|uniref:thiamine phosphate synthase n=1 Tax=Vibrio gallicus TaxID=190897 RepID=UPI0021C2C942|nr:thiamine phosphate synthase [Vibrio gallicus]